MARPNGSRVTLTDVAKRAGVSITTASFVLSGRTDMRISTATSDRVQQAARVLCYARGRQVSAATDGRMSVLGFISDNVAADQFAGEMLRGGITAAAGHGHGVITAETEGASPLEIGLVHDLIDRGVERFIYSAMSTHTVNLPAALKKRRTVLLNCVDPRATMPTVIPDERRAGALAARTLLEVGHTDAVWLVGDVNPNSYAARERAAGISETLAEKGLTLDRHVLCAWWPPDARTGMAAALASREEARGKRSPTAVIAMNDRVAMGVYQAAAEAGLSIPGDLSVISFDNSELSWWLSPELTSIGLPHFEMGRRAVELLLEDPAQDHVELLPMPLHQPMSLAPRD